MFEKVDGRSRKTGVSRGLSCLAIAMDLLFQMLRTSSSCLQPGFWLAGSGSSSFITSCRHPSAEDLACSAQWVPELGHSSRSHHMVHIQEAGFHYQALILTVVHRAPKLPKDSLLGPCWWGLGQQRSSVFLLMEFMRL